MTDESIEDKLIGAFDLYEHGMKEWDAEIFLDELELLYSIRERINKIILKMKSDISKAMECPT